MRLLTFSLLLGVATAACVASEPDRSSATSESDIIGMGTSPDSLPALEPSSVLALGAYATPLERAEGVPKLASGVVVYKPRWELWSDGAGKRRFILLPAGQRIRARADGAWEYPAGTRLFKEFYVEGRLVETRVIEKAATGFHASTYVWSADGADAVKDTHGLTIGQGAASHVVPAQEACASCHNDGKNAVLGLGAVQLDPAMAPADAEALFEVAPRPFEWSADVDEPTRATLGYLHANCGHCHREAEDTAFFQLLPGESGKPRAELRAFRAVRDNAAMMLYRITANEMPPLGVARVDPRASEGDVATGIKAIESAPAP